MQAKRSADRLESSLWDRLAASEATPESPNSRQQQYRRLRVLREQIQREVLFLLTSRQRFVGDEASRWRAVESSVLNFGLPDFSGLTSSGVDLGQIARLIQRKLEHFEPRFHRGSIAVECRFASQPDHLIVFIGGQFGPTNDAQTFVLEVVICLTSGEISEYLG
ncbi:type VI secretion system baseplate subunit TssE [Planctomycetaceae bacterium SH139]